MKTIYSLYSLRVTASLFERAPCGRRVPSHHQGCGGRPAWNEQIYYLTPLGVSGSRQKWGEGRKKSRSLETGSQSPLKRGGHYRQYLLSWFTLFSLLPRELSPTAHLLHSHPSQHNRLVYLGWITLTVEISEGLSFSVLPRLSSKQSAYPDIEIQGQKPEELA